MKDIRILRNAKKRKNRLKKEALSLNYLDDSSGKDNIKIFDYDTKNFDICPRAISAMESLTEEAKEGGLHEDVIDLAEDLAESIDELFEIEKQKEITKSDLKDAYDSFYESSYRVGQIALAIDDSLDDEFEFLTDHLKTIVEKSLK